MQSKVNNRAAFSDNLETEDKPRGLWSYGNSPIFNSVSKTKRRTWLLEGLAFTETSLEAPRHKIVSHVGGHGASP